MTDYKTGKQCPPPDELSKFSTGQLPGELVDDIGEHIEHCQTCSDTLAVLNDKSDTLVTGLQRAETSPEACNDADRDRVVKLIREVGPETSATSAKPAAEPQPVPVVMQQLLADLSSTGLLTSEEVAEVVRSLPVEKRGDTQELAKALVRSGKLTKFQATAVYQGKVRGLVFGEYVVLDKIGAGGMGMVYRAIHRRMKREVAIKVLPGGSLDNVNAIDRFYREVEAAAKLLHPNIVTAFDAGQHGKSHFLVMEYVAGQDLSQIVKQRGPLPVATAVEFIMQAAQGLEYAHSEGLVHRDIKPANLLVDKKGTVKILDMGLARLTNIHAADDGLTKSGQIMGTVDYMAPEQATNTRTADARADVYSLGCTLYRLLTDSPVFTGNTIMNKMVSHMNAPPPSLRAFRQDVPEALDAVYQRMLAKQPDARQQSMREVIQQLRESMAGADASLGAIAGVTGDGVGEQTSDSRLTQHFQDITPTNENSATNSQVTLEPTLTLNPAASTDPQSDPTLQPPSRPPTWIKIAASGGGAILLAGIVFLLNLGGKYDVQITLDDPSMSLKVDGETVIIEGSDKPIRLSAGEHTLHVEMNGFESDTDSFTVKKDGKNAVHVARLDGKLEISPGGKPAAQRGVATTNATTTTHQRESADYALVFDGVDDHVVLPKLPWDGGAFTVEATVQAGAQAFPNGMVIAINSGNGFSMLSVDMAGVPVFGRMEKETLQSTFDSTAIDRAATRPNHMAGVWSNGEASLYLDGRLASREVGGTYAPLGKYGPQAMIGAILQGDEGAETPMNFLKGIINELRVSSVARYSTDFSPPAVHASDAQTIALYHFDEGTGNILKDSSGNNHHGKIVGAKWARVGPLPKSAPGASAPPLAVAPFDAATAKRHQEAWAKHLGTTVSTTNSVGAKMILIPPGEFLMGSTDEQIATALKVAAETGADQAVKDRISKSESPQHRVVIAKPWRIGATEVTVGEFSKFVDATGYKTEAEQEAIAQNKPQPTPLRPGFDVTLDSPAVWINWTDAKAYCRWLSEQEQTTYRLATEAEWEYACRAGTTTQFSFGDQHALLDQYAWNLRNADGKSHPVGTKRQNAFGLYDMHGNVSEWCEDVWNEEAYGKPSTTATTGPAANLHILRGGEWKFYMILCRSASRYFSSRYHESENIGFRVVQVLDAPVTRLGSADRIAAEWLITKGGDVFITGREDAVTDVNDLPGGDIQVRQVKFRKPPLTGEDRKLLPLRGLQYLEYVSLDTSRVSADGIAVLESLPALRRLSCGSPTFTRENFAAICRLKKLSALYLTGNQLTALDCEALATHIPNLTSLNLCSSPTIDDSAIQTLQGLKNLKSLQLQGTSVTAEGVAALKRTLPDCVVEWDGQADDASK